MRKSITTVISAMMLTALGSGFALAQEEESDEPNAVPVETWACDYRDGKGPADLDKVIATWNDWMDAQGMDDYYAATLTPNYFGEHMFDVGWLGAWKDGHAMGAGSEIWLSEGSEMSGKFFEVLDCKSHTNFVSLNVQRAAPEENADNSFVLSFSNCSTKEGKTFDDFLAAQKEWNTYADENGFVNSAWVMFPIYGESNNDYDFKYVTADRDYTTFGANYQLYSDGHWEKSNELFDGLLDCDVDRLYTGTTVRRMADDE